MVLALQQPRTNDRSEKVAVEHSFLLEPPMRYPSFSAFTLAIRQSLRTAMGRLPPAGAWLCFLLGGLFLYGALSRLTPIILFGRQADGVVTSLRYMRGRHVDVLPTVGYALPGGQIA